MKNEERTLIFLHIPKAAGTTLHKIIETQYPSEAIFTIDGRNTLASKNELQNYTSSKLSTIKVIKGHMSFGWHEFLSQPCTYITILREPVERVISHYYYVLRTKRHYLHDIVKSKGMNLEDYITSGISVELDNGQTRLLSGVEEHIQTSYAINTGVGFGNCSAEMLEQAKQNLKNYFSVVGIAENFDESLMLMKMSFNWRLPFYLKKNVTKDRPNSNHITPCAVSAIEHYNQYDLELYQYVLQLFEEQTKQKRITFQAMVKVFNLGNYWYPTYRSFRRRSSRLIKQTNLT